MSKTDPSTGRQINECPETDSHNRHMANLRGISTTQGRREYIEAVQRAEGRFAANWLKDDLVAEWNKGKS